MTPVSPLVDPFENPANAIYAAWPVRLRVGGADEEALARIAARPRHWESHPPCAPS